MSALSILKGFGGSLLLVLVIAASACQTAPVAENTNTNANTASVNINTTPVANTNTAPISNAGPIIETHEPDRYRATLVFTAEASGKPQALALPIEVARHGDDRRYAFNIPTVGPVIFLDRADKRYLIMPSRKQYAELTPETVGFDIRSMTPGQMVAQLQKQPGIERVGEEQLNGRPVIKYRYAATAKTGSTAGEVKTESFVYIDKETGLPLRAEGFGQSTGNVQGVNSGRIIAELRDIKTDVEPSLFELPQGYNQITAEQIKQQMSALAAVFQVLLNSINAAGGSASPATTSTTPAITVSPSPTTH